MKAPCCLSLLQRMPLPNGGSPCQVLPRMLHLLRECLLSLRTEPRQMLLPLCSLKILSLMRLKECQGMPPSLRQQRVHLRWHS